MSGEYIKDRSCGECGQVQLQIVSGPYVATRGDVQLEIAGVEQIRCAACGAVYFTPAQARALDRRVADEIRTAEGLITPSDIQALRDRLGLTQQELEQLLGVGAKTVVRWERGTVCPNMGINTHLEIFRRVAESGLLDGLSHEKVLEQLARRCLMDLLSHCLKASAPAAKSQGARVSAEMSVQSRPDFGWAWQSGEARSSYNAGLSPSVT